METAFLHTDKNIFKHQNCKLLLQCLVAQRQEYSKAKKAEAWKGSLIISFALISIFASWLDVEWLTAVSSLLAISLLIIAKYIDKFINEHKTHAASIQQYFDVTLYSDALCINKSEWGELPTHSDIADSMSVINESALSGVIDWYSDYSKLPTEQQVFHCQRENIRWDQELRKEYYTIQIILLAVLLMITVVVALAVNPTFIKMICVIAWFAPIVDYVISNFVTLNKDIRRLDELCKKCDMLERDITNKELTDIASELILIQHAIQENREKALMVPDWFYKRSQSNHQKKENKIADVIQRKGEKS